MRQMSIALMVAVVALLDFTAAQHWDAFLHGMLAGTKQTMASESTERLTILMNEAAIREIDWQLYHNWQLRLPEDQKDQIYASTFQQISDNIDEYVKQFMVQYETQTQIDMAAVLQKARDSWKGREPRSSEIQSIVKNYQRQIKGYINDREVRKIAKDYVRGFFKANFGQEEYKVNIWQRIKDLTPKFGGKISWEQFANLIKNSQVQNQVPQSNLVLII